MSTPQKRKGDKAERDVVKYLTPHAPKIRRTKAGGEKDLGDLVGYVDRAGNEWAIQVADRRWRGHGEILAKAAEAATQAEVMGVDWWVMIAKRPGCADVGGWFVWLPCWMLLDAFCVCEDIDRVIAEPRDLACVTVRAWLDLTSPEEDQ